nr:protein DOG1-like 4 [Tanacetum cinerariifolium]
MSNKSPRTPFNVTEFTNFFNGWLVRQEEYLHELRSTLQTREALTDNDALRALVARVLAHYQQYYEQKSRIANFDVSLVFSPPWFSSFERSFFWIAGFKPGLAFRIVNNSVDDMDGDQVERMERLIAEIKAEERELENEMARIQESYLRRKVAAAAIFSSLPHPGAIKLFNTLVLSGFKGWIGSGFRSILLRFIRQEEYLHELRSALQTREALADNDALRALVARVLAHYQQYYEQKSRIANFDVSLVFSPPWFSSFERSFFWIAGFKPGLAFRIVKNSVDDMDGDQVERMERLIAETKAEERELENEMARIQESVAAPPIVEVVRRSECGGNIDGIYDDMARAIEGLRTEMELVLANADMLRSRTAERVVEILSPV